jgi:hypothetical protein
MSGTVTCQCGALVPDVPEVRTGHLYGGAVPGCFAAYAELQGRQYSDPGLAEARTLAVDAYMAQHPGVPGRQAAQSVWVHLIGLCATLEHGADGLASARVKARAAAPDAVFDWLEPPPSLGSTTVFDVLATATPDEHRAAVRRWAQDVWHAWTAHQPAIRRRAAAILAGPLER